MGVAKSGHVFRSSGPKISASDIEDFCYAVGSTSEKYIGAQDSEPVVPLDYAMRIFWPSLCKCLMSSTCNGDLMNMVHLSSGICIVPGAKVPGFEQNLSSSAKIIEVTSSELGRVVRVKGYIAEGDTRVLELDTSFVFRNAAENFSCNFRDICEPPMLVSLADSNAVALIRSKEWFLPLDAMDARISLGAVLKFQLESRYRFKSAKVYSHVSTFGAVLAQASSMEWIKVADVDFESGEAYGNPVIDFLERHGRPATDEHRFEGEGYAMIPEGRHQEAVVTAPSCNQLYSSVSADHNPIHTSGYFADYVGLPGTITHGMWTSASTRKSVEVFAADSCPERIRSYEVQFTDMVLPGDTLETRLFHVGFRDGRKLVQVQTFNQHGSRVIEGMAEVEQPPTAFIFTGQGAHEPGMGMGLYARSEVARRIWDSADEFMRETYGVPLIDIVSSNPKTHTVSFVGKRGMRVRDNYRSMVYEYSGQDGSRLISRPLFPDINENTESFTFASPHGLLYATQFTQAAMLVCEIAEFAHVESTGVVPSDAVFAGHSLGEYAGLASIGGILTPESAADIGFCRGLTMQQSVRRDASNRSIYGMMAVSPRRVASYFRLDHLACTVAAIKEHGNYDGLLEIVNYNVRDHQYVVSGELVLLEALSRLLDAISPHASMPENLAVLSRQCVRAACMLGESGPCIELKRTRSTIPIPGIDVPFHSSLLNDGSWSFRKMLRSRISLDSVSVERLRHRYIPNLTAQPFDITRSYAEHVYSLTRSEIAGDLMRTLDEARLEVDHSYAHGIAYKLLIEILSYQFSSPVRWIETQDVLLHELRVGRIVEIGPGNVLTNMVRHTIGSLSLPGSDYGDSLNDRLDIMSTSTDMNRVLFLDLAEASGSAAASGASGQPLDSANASDNQASKDGREQQQQQQASDGLLPVSTGSRAIAKEIEDVPTQPLDVMRALIAHKLKCKLSAISDTKPIKDFVGGKSTLQNEIVGDLQKEFSEDLPEKTEEIPLCELAQGLSPISGSLGKHTLGMLARLISSKLPGGFNKAAIAQHLGATYGLGPLRQDALLLVALTMEPPARLDSEAAAKEWLAAAAVEYSKTTGVQYRLVSAAGTGDHNRDGQPVVSVINSADFETAQSAHRRLARQNMHALATFLGVDVDQRAGNSGPSLGTPPMQQMSEQLGIWASEYGEDYHEAIRPAFSAAMARQFDSFWNWARQDLLELHFSMIQGKAAKLGQSIAVHYLRLVNRFTPSVVSCLKYIVQLSEKESSRGHTLASKYGASLIKLTNEAVNTPPAYQFTQRHLAPRLGINEMGGIEYLEADRPGERTVSDYVRAITDRTGIYAHAAPHKRDDALGTILQKLGLARAATKQQPKRQSLPPMVHLKSKAASPTCWEYDPDLSATLSDTLNDICENGLSLSNKKVLVTGCGKGSIGAEVLRGLLEAGANVVATTSSHSLRTARYFQDLYQAHGSRGSSLVVVPFNQASKQDIDSIVEYIYGDPSKGRGLGWDLDYVLPFAAIPELGHDITELDSRSELAHRAMLTNVLRLLGTVASHKKARRYDMHPTLAILPLSPNHGAFGFDGLYGESKIGLETLLSRWHSESWAPFISLTGAVIGWTRGTGLMSANNIVSEGVERLGVRTFSAAEMAFNILGAMHPKMYALAALGPVWADMSGNFQYYPEITRSISELRKAHQEMESVLKSVAADSQLDYNAAADSDSERVYGLHTVSPLANHKFKFPAVKSYDQLSHLRHLQGMANLDKVVVITGYGEVGPYGNAETRWEMEAYGEFSLEGCIELAWIMGYIKHFSGKHKKTGKVYVGWVDAKSDEPVEDRYVKLRYEKQILEHTGIRLIEPELLGGYDPNQKHIMRELQIEHDMDPFEATEEEAGDFKRRNGDRVRIWANDSGSWSVRFLKGSTLMVPKALRFDRLVAAQLPTGWDPVRYGIPRDIADQVDPITCYALVAAVESLVRSGITDPYEIYKYVHVSEVGSSTGAALGGQKSTKRVFAERLCDKDQPPDVYQETFLTTPPAWINMLLLSASGPIKTTIGACATGVASVDVAVDTIQSGKAKIMLAGGLDGFSEESSYEFAQMNATSNALDEFAKGRSPAEMSRPCTSTRSGFMESEGAGIATLMSASTALEMGVPVYGIIAMSGTATDKEGRSVPAPGKGVLTSAREVPGTIPSPLLDISYRRRQLAIRQRQIQEWADLERAQSRLGATAEHLGRTPGNVVFSICQKHLTGHPKGAAAMWMLNGVVQSMRTGVVPGNRNADNIAAELEECEYIVYPSRSIQTPGIKAGLLKSFGFGQVGGEILVVHPDYLFAVLAEEQLEKYARKVDAREKRAYRYWHDTLVGNHQFVQVKTEPPYTPEQERQVYLDPLARADFDPATKRYAF
ncbi:hypothetical protein GQ54DRAFT_290323 [Martensiomyces pterosporus]|nr:hypothetical protein GQ54DRAFT_290323 [Martensiomyces pterosporus]